MSPINPASDTASCRYCGSEISSHARLCHVCRNHITQPWKNTLTYFGSVVGVIIVIFSGAVFVMEQTRQWYTLVTWKDTIKVVYFEYPGYSGILNNGSGDIVLMLITLKWPGEPDKLITIPVNQKIHKDEFKLIEAKSPFGRPKNADAARWLRQHDAPAEKVLASAIDGIDRTDRCIEYHFHDPAHTIFKRISSLDPTPLFLAEPVEAVFHIISLATGEEIELTQTGFQSAFLYIDTNPNCSQVNAALSFETDHAVGR